jgi:hypothetical protein
MIHIHFNPEPHTGSLARLPVFRFHDPDRNRAILVFRIPRDCLIAGGGWTLGRCQCFNAGTDPSEAGTDPSDVCYLGLTPVPDPGARAGSQPECLLVGTDPVDVSRD